MYFDQLLGAAHTQKLIELQKSTEKDNFGVPPQGVDQLLGACSIQKLVEIHNSYCILIMLKLTFFSVVLPKRISVHFVSFVTGLFVATHFFYTNSGNNSIKLTSLVK